MQVRRRSGVCGPTLRVHVPCSICIPRQLKRHALALKLPSYGIADLHAHSFELLHRDRYVFDKAGRPGAESAPAPTPAAPLPPRVPHSSTDACSSCTARRSVNQTISSSSARVCPLRAVFAHARPAHEVGTGDTFHSIASSHGFVDPHHIVEHREPPRFDVVHRTLCGKATVRATHVRRIRR